MENKLKTNIQDQQKGQITQKDLQKLLDSSLDVICSFDAEGKFLAASAATKWVWGYEPDELLGKRYMDLVHPDDHAKTIATAEGIIGGSLITNFQNRYIKKDGSLVPITWSARWDKNESIMYCVARDSTEKKEIEEKLERAKRMFESFMNNSPIVGWITDENCIMRYMNGSYLAIYGFTEADFGKSIYKLFTEQTAADFHANNLRVLKEGKAVETIEKAVLADGTEQVLKVFKFPLYIDGMHMVGGWAVDLTAMVELQRELEKSIERFNYANEATSDAIYDLDLSTNIISRGSGYKKIFGHEEKEVSFGERISFIHPDDQERYKLAVYGSLEDQLSNTWKIEYRFRNASGEYREIIDKAFILKSNEKAVRVIGAMQDVTEQKQLQRKLLEQEKKARRNVIKSIIEAQEKDRIKLSRELHDNVQQVLDFCKLHLQFAKSNKEAAQSLTERSYNSITHVIDEVKKISQELNPLFFEDTLLTEAIQQMINKINASGKLNIHFRQNVNFTPFKEEDKITIYRIIQEQISNILKHAGATNTIIVLSVQDNETYLSIQDDGIGFDVENVKKGYGLKNIFYRVEYHNGSCNVISTPGNGCKLEVKLKITSL